MNNRETLTKQAADLISLGEKVLETEITRTHSGPVVNEVKFHEFRISSLSYLSRVFTDKSTQYQSFKAEVTHATSSRTKRGLGILKSAEREITGDWLETTRGALIKDVLTGLLRQAKSHAEQKNFKAAAIVTGTVVDMILRTLCHEESIKIHNEIQGKAIPKKPLQLAGDAYKKKIYDRQTNKMIMGWIELYNDAAEDKETDKVSFKIEQMISGVQSFLAKTRI